MNQSPPSLCWLREPSGQFNPGASRVAPASGERIDGCAITTEKISIRFDVNETDLEVSVTSAVP